MGRPPSSHTRATRQFSIWPRRSTRINSLPLLAYSIFVIAISCGLAQLKTHAGYLAPCFCQLKTGQSDTNCGAVLAGTAGRGHPDRAAGGPPFPRPDSAVRPAFLAAALLRRPAGTSITGRPAAILHHHAGRSVSLSGPNQSGEPSCQPPAAAPATDRIGATRPPRI